ncbi:MAG: hypothetical protein HWE23_10500 [Rhodobacteraceae bacterium]|nr:hypothetical protein [Paracoccaceae bacterium]
MTSKLPSINEAKAQAKRLRTTLEADGKGISHCKALEIVAHQHGYRDWNTLFAAIGNRPPKLVSVGDRIKGRYLSQPFEADVLAVEMVGEDWMRVTLDLDEAVDVVTFDSFSSFRKRVRGLIGPKGSTREKTSDGVPHLELDL